MAFFRTLIKTLTRNPKPKSVHHPHSLLPSPNPFSLFPLPLSGSLFHSPTPWNLSHFSTPFHLRGKDVIFPKDLVQVRRSLPFELGFRGEVEDGVLRRRSGSGSGSEEKVVVAGESGDGFLNLPNLVSIGRGVSGPFIGWMIMNEWYLPAFCGLAISGATDWLDGFLARKMGINSVFGSYLDPLADKVLIGCVALAMVKQDLLHPALVGLVVFRDCALVAGAVYKRASSLGWEWNSWSEFANLDATHREKVEPLFISKVNTVFQLLLVAGALLQPELGTEETQLYIDYLSWLVASTTVASSAAYGVQHLRYRGAFTPAKR